MDDQEDGEESQSQSGGTHFWRGNCKELRTERARERRCGSDDVRVNETSIVDWRQGIFIY